MELLIRRFTCRRRDPRDPSRSLGAVATNSHDSTNAATSCVSQAVDEVDTLEVETPLTLIA